jgi:hypothetical protein
LMANDRLSDALDALFSAPLEKFIETREALVKELRAAGDKDAATTVKAQHKPTVAAHALNQLARAAGPELDKLFAASRQLATGKNFKAALERQRTLLEELRAKMSGPAVPELLAIVRGAMVDEALAERLKLGRFSTVPEVQVGFFGAAPEGGAMPRAEKQAAHSKVPPRPQVDHAAVARAKAEEAERAERARRLARELEVAELELTRLTAAADEAEHQAARARRLAEEAAEKVRRLSRQGAGA